MKISIVTLSFNQAKYLGAAIESLLQQGYPNLEYVIVDPGSQDGSRGLIESYGDRIARVIFEKDRGAADGLNKGFSVCTGDVFGFLNADDLLLPGSLATVAKYFSDHPQCELALGNGIIVDGEDKVLRHVRARTFTVNRYLHGGARFLQQSTFFRRGLFERVGGFNLNNRTCWDGELFVTMAKHDAKIGYIPEDLGAFRLHSESQSGSNRALQAYLLESGRIFRDVAGRHWDMRDRVLKTYYRGDGALRKVFSFLGSSKKRASR